MTGFRGFESSFFRVEGDSAVAVLVMTRRQLTEEENLEQLDQEFRSLVDTFGLKKVVLNLHAVSYLTSSAIGKLITWHRQMIRNEGRLVLAELTPDVRAILDMSHLLSYFHVCDTVPSAVAELT